MPEIKATNKRRINRSHQTEEFLPGQRKKKTKTTTTTKANWIEKIAFNTTDKCWYLDYVSSKKFKQKMSTTLSKIEKKNEQIILSKIGRWPEKVVSITFQLR